MNSVPDGNQMVCTIKDLDKVEGEATANNRKGKLIFFYEWNLELKWEGLLAGDDTAHQGKITIPNLSEENDMEDIEITISIEKNDEESNKLKSFMYNVGRDKIRQQLGVYLKDLKEEYSKGLILPSKDATGKAAVKPDAVKTFASGFNKSCNINNNKKPQEEKPLGYQLDVKSLNIKEKFQCRASELYNALTTVEMVMAFTRGPVTMEPIKGGEFKLFGGNVEGKFQELVPYSKIAQTWRLRSWPSGHYSNVTIEIEEKNDYTSFKLTQTGVPTAEADATRVNWERYYINSIKQTFGFGSFLV